MQNYELPLNINTQSEIILNEDGQIELFHAIVDDALADSWFKQLQQQIRWQTEVYTIYGRQVAAPRLTAWFGDNEAEYQYSGISHLPQAWTEVLQHIRTEVQDRSGQVFNSVLANLYRDGQDSMGWHADNEPELGDRPVIASLSLGAGRLFKLRHRTKKTVVNVNLQHGNLLIMSGDLQAHWQHAVPKTKRPVDARINLTFRRIIKHKK